MNRWFFILLLAVAMMMGTSFNAFCYSYQFYHTAVRDYGGQGNYDHLQVRFGFTIRNDDGSWPQADTMHISYTGADNQSHSRNISNWGPYMESIGNAGTNPSFSESNYYRANLPLSHLDIDGSGGSNNIQNLTITLNNPGGIVDELDVHLPLFHEIPAYNGFDVTTLRLTKEAGGYGFHWDPMSHGGSDTSIYRFIMSAYDETTGTDYELQRRLSKNTTDLFITDDLLGNFTWDISFQERLLNEDENAENEVWIRSYQGDSAEFSPVPIPGAIWLLGSGLVGIVGLRRKLRK